jgi:hypothetical protein
MLSDEQLGGIAVHLALEFPVWIQRRVEHIAYLDGATIRQTEGIMLRWPQPDFFPPGVRPDPGDMVYLPLDQLTKESLTGLDGMRPDGSPFPILPYSRSTAVASAGIMAMVWGLSMASRGYGLQTESLDILDRMERPGESGCSVRMAGGLRICVGCRG